MRGFLAGVVVVLVLLAGAFWYFRRRAVCRPDSELDLSLARRG